MIARQDWVWKRFIEADLNFRIIKMSEYYKINIVIFYYNVGSKNYKL